MHRALTSTFSAAFALTLSVALAGCLAAASDEPVDEGEEVVSGSRVEALNAEDAVSRARQWVAVGMPYCGGVNGGTDYICNGTCMRTGAAANPEWDQYRSDCSGLVSFAWGLPPPGRVTGTLPEVSQAISGWDLAPGDILNNSNHVVLFAGWVDRNAGTAVIIHEPDCGRTATEVQVQLGIGDGSYVNLWGDGYTALRYVNIEQGPGGGGGDACGGLTYQGTCENGVLKWCEGGAVKVYDCGATGRGCGWESDAVGYNCVGEAQAPTDVPQNNCGDVNYHGYCDGSTLVWCAEGQLKTYDCAASSKSCGWQNDTEGHNCL